LVDSFGEHGAELKLEMFHAVIRTTMRHHHHIIKFLIGVFRGEARWSIVVGGIWKGVGAWRRSDSPIEVREDGHG